VKNFFKDDSDSGDAQFDSVLPAVIFLGSGLHFSDPLIQMAQNEFSDVHISRVAELRSLTTRSGIDPATICAVIVEEKMLDQLISDPGAFRKAAPNAQLVLAYHAPEAAKSLLARQYHDPTLACISFLPMNVQFDAWRSIIRLTLCGEGYLPRNLLLEVTETPPGQATPKAGILTQRETEVLGLVSEGKPNKIIAAELGLSEHTIKLHMHNIIVKLGVKNRTEAAAWHLSQRAAPP
jgi:DNA-binding CsgD family transcriptional regulator